MPYEACFKFVSFLLTMICAGCIAPASAGPAVNLTDSGKAMTFKEIATEVIRPGMQRDEVLRTMRGYLVCTTQSSDTPPKFMDIFGNIEGKRDYLYVAAWEGRHSWGVYPVGGEFGMVVRYDHDMRVERAYDTDTTWANH